VRPKAKLTWEEELRLNSNRDQMFRHGH
jgi:hypothetical protein